MHRKKGTKIQERKRRRIRGIILGSGFADRNKGEIVCKITVLEVMEKLRGEQLEVHIIPDIEKGEVLLDPRGEGSFQNIQDND